MKKQKLKAVYFGRFGETFACFALRLKRYRIIARNVRTNAGEIDIIARHGKTLCFIEVKSRKTHRLALESLSVRQQNRIIRAAWAFLSQNPRYSTYQIRFDFMAVVAYRWPLHLKNAWLDKT